MIDVVFDLRDVNQGRPQLYEEFWNQVEAFINEKALEAVDSRRHGTMCDLAAALSVRDLRDQILQKKIQALRHHLDTCTILAKKSFS